MKSFKYLSDKEKIDRLQNRIERLEKKIDEDRIFYGVCLNLTGKRKEIENRAFEFIKYHGIDKALLRSRKKHKKNKKNC